MENDTVSTEPFNRYVLPPLWAMWNPKCEETTGLNAQDSRIVNADCVEKVWNRFIMFLAQHQGKRYYCCMEWGCM
jgi:inhibitor of KinA sporulation pathway (predicted exonuclease)